MDPLHAIAILVTLAAAFSYLNHHFLKMPMTIGLMVMSLLTSLALILLELLGLPVKSQASALVGGIDFSKVLLEGMLGLLLFAGALHVNLDDLMGSAVEIGVFATLGVAASTVIVGVGVFLFGKWLDLGLGLLHCLIFGALISPTDPIAVMGILKSAGAPKSLETKIAGESLFNDGFGVVVFLILYELAYTGTEVSVGRALALFATEAVGGAVYGLVVGYLAYWLLKSTDHYEVEIMITLALAVGGYSLALALHLSAPIAIVLAGLLIGNRGRRLAMSDRTREHLDMFWELVDAILNALLFVLIGLEVLVLSLTGQYLLAGALAVPVALAARLISVGVPIGLMRVRRPFAPRAIRVMTWGGLRGGISVALALALPPGPQRELILTMTYVVVVFSVVFQGLTVRHVVSGGRAERPF